MYIYNLLQGQLEEQKHELKKLNSSSIVRCLLWCVRIFINLLVIGILVGAGAAIFFAQKFSLEVGVNSFGVKFQTTFVVCFFILTNYRLERRLYVKLKV